MPRGEGVEHGEAMRILAEMRILADGPLQRHPLRVIDEFVDPLA